jgi:hypothetical protein
MEDNQNTVLVCGGRLYNDKAYLFSCLDAYCAAVGGFSRFDLMKNVQGKTEIQRGANC